MKRTILFVFVLVLLTRTFINAQISIKPFPWIVGMCDYAGEGLVLVDIKILTNGEKVSRHFIVSR